MSSGMKLPLPPDQPTPSLNESAAEPSESGGTKTEKKQHMSDDRTAGNGHNQRSIQNAKMPHVGIHRSGMTPGGKLNPRRGRYLFADVNPLVFVLPPPARQKLPPSGQFPRKAARQEGTKPSETTRRFPRKPLLETISRANTRPHSLQKPSLSVNAVNGAASRQDDKISFREPPTVSHSVPSVELSGKLTTTETSTTRTKAPKSQANRTPRTVGKSDTKDVKPNSSPTTRTKASKSQANRTPRTVGKSCTKDVKLNSSPVKTQEEEKVYITTKSPYHVGRAWQPLPVKPIGVPPLSPSFKENDQIQHSWFILHETPSVDDAWNAYTTLNECAVPVPLAALHRMVRLVARERPRASTEYTRLLEILKRIRSAGGKVYPHEWNTLIDVAGGGLRNTTVRHYEMALSFFRDMTKGRAPGTTLALDSGSSDVEDETTTEPVEADIYTYTTLLGIAARTKEPKCLRHARTLLERSGIPPNRFTHLALIPYFSVTSQLGAVRSTLILLEGDRMEVGLDGINALLLAYSRNRRLDVVTMIYRLLKHNLTPDLEDIEDETARLEEYRRQLRTEEFIVVPDYLVPNQVTYTSLIQIMAYHGHLSSALKIFADMLAAPNTEHGAPLIRDADGVLKPSLYQPTSTVFRALFLGFRRHALKVGAARGVERGHICQPRPKRNANSPDEWTLNNLQRVLDLFMSMPSDMQMGRSAFYWLIVAFQITSGNDRQLLRDVWRRVEGRFRISSGPNNRLYIIKASLFSETETINHCIQ
ncbi:hypothetical protein C0995_004328 [Termitomyces sp. Mi166|nr:hypothetical protein C0995_004328 [Termitomyces sp. Mi166\